MSSDVPSDGSKGAKDEPATKFIHTQPGEQSSPKLFVSNAPEDGYDLTFANLEEFQAWRRLEEETHTVEFVKGDTHTSRTNPPRFKEHVKLVCARHTRRGRKQYVKKHPERTRKTPSRKIDGVGCPASICYKTYVHTDVVRVMYTREHSHPIGLENLPFTRKGQKALKAKAIPRMPTTSVTSTSEDESGASTSIRSPSFSVHTISSWEPRPELGGDVISHRHTLGRLPSIHGPSPRHPYVQPLDHQLPRDYHPIAPIQPPASTSRLEPSSPAHTTLGLHDQSLSYDPAPLRLPDIPSVNDRWERLAVLFRSVHMHALTYDYPEDSVDALEGMLVRLYLESPFVGAGLRGEDAGEMGLGPIEEAELGIPDIGPTDMNQLGTMGMIGDMSLAHQRQDPELHMQPHPHHNLHHH
ncbi:hypothetical protein RhiJN_11127 [Ceratobasidium sp. AG-Ba]|nr:hypothetical protein RhiJN_11127 [Ceratobasidium sp. AG-Ba]QRW11830.1 hypothetical protein RhiLY_10829 [Ceratobasidium sp. AG-Ba]